MTTTVTPFFKAQQLTSARVVSATNLTGTYTNGTQGVGARLVNAGALAALTIDSVAVVADDRVMLAAQTAANQNGIYVVIDAGSSVAPWILERATDFHSIEQIKAGYFCPIEAGTVGAGDIYVVVEPLPAVLGVSDLVFAPSLAGGLGTMAVQNANAVNITGGTITGLTDLQVAADALKLADTNATHFLVITPGSNLTANRVFTITTGDAARTLDISAANVTVSAFGATLVDDATKLVALTTLGVKRATTAAYAGGGTSNAFVATGLVATDIVVATILASTNDVAIAKAVPTADTLTVTFTADPGAATTVSWIAIATV